MFLVHIKFMLESRRIAILKISKPILQSLTTIGSAQVG